MAAEEGRSLPQGRVMSVDALRGFDMFWIAGGGELVKRLVELFRSPMPPALERQFEHVPWEGFVAWDLIMPLFLFIVGTSMPLAYARRLEKGQTHKSIYLHMIRRILILWVLGMVAQGNLLSFDVSKLHFYSNTLQSIAAGYLVATVVILNFTIVWQAVITTGLLVLFWLLMVFVPVPGHGAGMLTPEGNLAMYIDEALLGRFRDGTPYTWILSSITFAATVLLGVMSGHVIQSKLPPKNKALVLFAAGIAGLVLGRITGIWFPIIKHIWTSSFVLYAAGWSFLLLAFFYVIMDVWGYSKWAFGFVVIGMNAIVAYMLTEFLSAGRISDLVFGKAAANFGAAAHFLMAGLCFGVLWLVLYAMYRKRVFVRI